MSPRLPRVTAAQVIGVLEQQGFTVARQSGSHRIYIDQHGKRVTVLYHGGRTLHPKILMSILADAELSVDEFIRLL